MNRQEKRLPHFGFSARCAVGDSRTRRRASGALDVHLAEYEALTSRCTSWLTLMVPIWAVLATFLTVIAAFWNSFPDHIALLWSLGVGSQLVILMWFQTIEEQYRAIFYVQRQLRPRVEKIVGISGFWTYESYSAGRDDHLSWWGEWFSPPIFVCLLLAFGIVRWPLHPIDYAGLSVNIPLVVIQVLKTVIRVRLRRSVAEAEEDEQVETPAKCCK
jgi:hypothetical protein